MAGRQRGPLALPDTRLRLGSRKPGRIALGLGSCAGRSGSARPAPLGSTIPPRPHTPVTFALASPATSQVEENCSPRGALPRSAGAWALPQPRAAAPSPCRVAGRALSAAMAAPEAAEGTTLPGGREGPGLPRRAPLVPGDARGGALPALPKKREARTERAASSCAHRAARFMAFCLPPKEQLSMGEGGEPTVYECSAWQVGKRTFLSTMAVYSQTLREGHATRSGGSSRRVISDQRRGKEKKPEGRTSRYIVRTR